MCRYLPLLVARGADVTCSVPPPLRSLLQRLHPALTLMGHTERPHAFDLQCSIMGLPLAFGTDVTTIPPPAPMSLTDAAHTAAWRARLPPKTRPRIGIAWSGNAEHRNDHNRSLRLADIAGLFGYDADWIAVQKDIRPHDADTRAELGKPLHFPQHMGDFADTAALLDELDLVISVDTSIAHLAGIMGKKLWLLLPWNPDWRWLLDRDDSPWYPSARMFRQTRRGDWSSVLADVAAALRSELGPA